MHSIHVYVDGLMILTQIYINQNKSSLFAKFDKTDPGEASVILSIIITRIKKKRDIFKISLDMLRKS